MYFSSNYTKLCLSSWLRYNFLNLTFKLDIQFLRGNLFDVPQGFILKLLLFNIFLRDLFFIINQTDSASCADDSKPYRTVNNATNKVIQSLEHEWLYDVQMVL